MDASEQPAGQAGQEPPSHTCESRKILSLSPGNGRSTFQGSEGGIVKLPACQPYLPKKMQVRQHHHPGAEMDGGGERYLAGEVVGHEPNRHLALAMWLLIDGGRDRAFLKIGRHLREKVCRYQLCFSGEAARAEGAAHGKTIHGVHVESGKSWNLAQKIKRLLETLVFVLVSFNHTGDLASCAVPWKGFGKPRRFLAMIFGA